MIDLGTLTDEYEKEISIHTTATSKDGEKTILAGKEVTIVDTVKLDGLTKGTKYQLKGWQMLKEENAELIIDGKRVENDYTFFLIYSIYWIATYIGFKRNINEES